jgi:hypothetical protein
MLRDGVTAKNAIIVGIQPRNQNSFATFNT